MNKLTYLTVLSLFIGTILPAQTKVAAYSFGKPGTDKYEQLEFWTKDGKRTDVKYAYGKDGKNAKLFYIGIDQIKDNPCFKIRFTNNYTLYVIPNGVQLKVVDPNGKYNKTFAWEYEGPVNGIGTFCSICTENEVEAMKLIQTFYMK